MKTEDLAEQFPETAPIIVAHGDGWLIAFEDRTIGPFRTLREVEDWLDRHRQGAPHDASESPRVHAH